ncbi:putative integrase/recombinase protein [Burkholderia phage Bp-AMP3]|uniref:Integrase n=1 Tax=Burkholderia phage Bp-AMP3 TaxID=1673729 RepID=A0A0A8KXI4_9CAUD|nr:putative integrase/recombinase protein [Burkholderia phage Bp-AMP3]
MGTIVPREGFNGDVTYQAKIRRTGFPMQSRTFKTKKEAEQWMREVEYGMDKGAFRVSSIAQTATLKDMLETYRDKVSSKKKGGAVEVIRLNAMLDTKYAQYRLVNFTKDVVAKWRDERLEKVSGSTVNREMNLLGHVIEKARKEWGVELPENPVQEVERPKHSPHRERRLRDDEEARLLFAAEKARNKYLRPLIVLALETAMRRAELVNLQWEFIDIPKRRIHLIEGGGVNGDFSIKNGSSRVVPLSKRAIDALEAYQPDPAKRKGQVFEELTEEAVTQAFTRTQDGELPPARSAARGHQPVLREGAVNR